MRRNTPKSQRKGITPRRGDISTLTRIDNPDDGEYAAPLAPGDPDSLVAADNPDDIEDRASRKRASKDTQRP
ncbi:MAG: hypothetical protein ACOX4G_15765 [Limnochordia bacterium]|jgi:hypothetical protein